jgi:predicted GNAT superfamily acetyltransferase
MKNIRSAAAMAVLAAAAVLAANAAEAHALSLEECSEGSDFIKNAALARDEGMQERQFVAQFQADVQALQRLPAELRWFVQDKDDEVFLLSAVQDVFRRPKPATVHQAQFALACMRSIEDEPGDGVRI